MTEFNPLGFVGSCNHCGKCCQHMVFHVVCDHDNKNDWKEWVKLHGVVFLPRPSFFEDNHFLVKINLECSVFDSDNKSCGIHNDKISFCKEGTGYPLVKGCGYVPKSI